MSTSFDTQVHKDAAAVAPRRIGSRDFGSTLATNLAIQACTIVQGILLARILGPTGRGQFAAAILWPSLFASMGGFGVAVALARRAGRAADLGPIIRTGLLLTLLTGTIAGAACAIALPWLLPGNHSAARQAAYLFVPFILFNHVALGMVAIDQGAGWFSRMNFTRLIINPVYLILIVALWLAGVRDFWWYVLALVIANAVVALVRVALALKVAGVQGAAETPKAVLREALPFGLAGLLDPLTQSADKALLLYLLGTKQLGFYTVALTAASVVNSLAGAAGTFSFGISTQAKDREGFERVARLFRLTAWVWLVGGLAVAALIPVVLPLLYGRDFSPAIWPAILLIPVAALIGQSAILEQSIRGQGKAFIGLEARTAGLVALVIAGLLLARPLGIIGVVLAALIAQTIVLTAMMLATRWHFHRALLQTLRPTRGDFLELQARLSSLFRALPRRL